MLASLLSLAASAADCPERIPPAEIAGLLDEAEQAFTELHIDAFIDSTDAVRQALPCLGEVADSRLVARIHRNEGLRLFGERHVDAVRAFAAARSLEPDFAFPPEMVPHDSPILADWTAMALDAGHSELLPEPLTGTLFVDGRATLSVPRAWPALVQLVPADAAAPAFSVYLRHDSPPPEYPSERLQRRRSMRIPLMIATGATALTAATAYGGAWSSRVAWDNTEDDQRLDVLRARTNALTGASVVAGLASVASGAALVLVW